MIRIQMNEIPEIEQKIDRSSLDEPTQDLLKGVISGQIFLIDLIEKMLEASGYSRLKIIKEFAKILEFKRKLKKNDSLQANPDKGTTNESNEEMNSGNNEQDNSEEDESSLMKEEGNSDKEEEKPSKNHPKRGNAGYNPVLSHLHFHENLEPGDLCPECLIGRVYPFREKIIPILIGRSPLAFEEHRLQVLRCNACGEIFDPKLPDEIPKTGHSMPSAQATLILMHYQIGVPFASISSLQETFNQKVSSSQLWEIIESASETLRPIYNELKRLVANSKQFFTDDTSARILSHYPENAKNREKKKGKKDPDDRVATYTSVIIGCTFEGDQIYLDFHGRKYAGENLADLLKYRNHSLGPPIQMKDAATTNIPANEKIIESKCNSHAIRKFKDIQQLYPKECREVLKNYSTVAKNEIMLKKKGVSEAERLAYHKKNSLSLMAEIKKYVASLINDRHVEPNSSLGGAISYFCSHYTGLTAFCHIEGAPFDNNIAERALKMVIRLRKTSMFYKTEHGAEVAGILHSVLYTAQEAGINVLTYLQTLLENPDEVRKNPNAFLPWIFQSHTEEKKVGVI
jgi:transposase